MEYPVNSLVDHNRDRRFVDRAAELALAFFELVRHLDTVGDVGDDGRELHRLRTETGDMHVLLD